MISQFSIGNFKAFGDTPQSVPLKPLTIIFGPNSSGKSTILHSLLFAHHAARTGDLDVVCPELAEETVDLGGFRQFIHGAQHGIESQLSWAADCSAADLASHLDAGRTKLNRQLDGPESNDWRTLLTDTTTVQMSLEVGITRDRFGNPSPTALPQVQRLECRANGELLLSGFAVDGKMLQIDQVASDHTLISSMTNTLAATETFALELSTGVQEQITKEIDDLVADLQIETDGFLPKKLFDMQTKRRTGTENEATRPALGSEESIARTIRRLFPRMLNELVVGISDLVRKDLFTTKYLAPLRSYPPRHTAFAEARDLGSRAGGGQAWLEVANDKRVRDKVNQWLSDSGKLKTPYQLVLQRHYPQEAIAATAERGVEDLFRDSLRKFFEQNVAHAWYEIVQNTGTDPDADDLTEKAEPYIDMAADIAVEGAAHALTQALEEGCPSPPADIMLMDMRTKTTVSHRDVGIGISQVLPVLVNAYGSKNQILAIEQPEIHLHPALQSELADVFIESSLGSTRNRCVLETHSEHLILRILRRIRETTRGTLPKGTPAIRSDDVCVLYVHPQKSGSQVMEMRVSKDGQFLDPWPGGFFAERLREMLGA